MKHIYLAVLTLFALLVLAIPAGADNSGAQSPMGSMAKILHGLNHYPTDEEKRTLQNIMQQSPQGSHHHTLARAIYNLEHSVSSKDAPHLKAIISDTNAGKAEKDMARIILELNHKPGSSDKERLEMMMHR